MMRATLPRTLRILVVDDDRDTGDVLGEVLRIGGFNIRVAQSADQAVAVAATFRPDVAILDLMMPGTDGFATARQLQSQASLHGATYIAYSGLYTEEVLAKCKEVGIEHFMLKPADIAHIEDYARSWRSGPR